MSITLSIIIVNYNGAKYLPETLDSIFASQLKFKYEVIMIDNNSQDNSSEILNSYQERCTLIFNSENYGFSKANNQGIQIARGYYIFLLNNDTIVKPEAISLLLNFYKERPDIGAIGPKLINADGSLQTTGSIFSKWLYKTEAPREISFISGAAFLTTRDILEKTHGLDENFFFYNEDLDLCKQILKLGYKIYYFPFARIVHLGGEATKTRKSASIIEGYRGGLYYCRKHYGLLIYSFYRIILLLDLVPKILFYSLKTLVKRDSSDTLKAYIKILLISATNNIYLKR